MNEVEKIISSARDKYTVHECKECTYRKCCELVFGSADCMSRRVSISLMLGIEDSISSKLLDELESAVKQEKEEWEAAACACVSDAVMSGRVAVEHKPVGNAAAMYDALVKIAHYCDDKDGMDDPYCADGHILSDIARAALSTPPRNCDLPLVVDGPATNNADKAWLVFKYRNPGAYFDVPGLLRCIDWLLAPAAERKGDGNGR